MKILQLISTEGYYGAESMLLALARTLPGLGCVSIVGVFADARARHDELATRAARLGLRVETVPCAGRWDWKTVGRIRELVEAHGVDVLHTHGYKADVYGYAAAWRNRVALVATCHNWPSRLPSMRAYAMIDRLALRHFDRVATASGPVTEILKRWRVPARKLKTIPNGVDMEPFRGPVREPARDLRNELAGSSERLVGFVGRLVPDKGGAMLLSAARAVLAVYPNVKFVFAGDGPARAEWEALAVRLRIATRVVFAGKRDDMPAVYAALDIVVLPSLQEAMPMCLLEALAAAKPVVATAVGAVPRLIVPGVTGLLCEPGDANALATAILRLLRDPELGRTLGGNGRAHVERNFSAEVVGRSYIGLYQEACGAGWQPAGRLSIGPSSSTGCDVTIIVACRNECGHIRQFMDSLLAQDMSGMTWEAIVADGMSGDGTREILGEYAARHAELRTIDNPRRVVSPGLNAAIRAARGSIIIRMDAHTLYAPDYCRRCVAELERTGADNVGGPARTRTQGTRARAFAAAYHSPFSTGARFHDENYRGWIDTVPYGCWRKETLERLGLFDEALVRNQDDELNLRLTRAGGKIWQSPDIVSWYSPRATLTALFLQYFQYGFWKAAVVRKHRLPGSWRHLVPMAFVLAHILLFAACIVTVASNARGFAVAGGLWLMLLLAYAAANVTASVAAARKSGWATLPYLPAVFTVYHFSWGLGFLAGFRWFLPGAAQPLTNKSFFTRISR